ncbi:outer membrane lipoprotein carrier protein LolA [Kordiimonas sp. SCSIO 12610]|uniref:LolA family protein n=1 Tax=Kordiimonas sp. SCSIO 12610 TaxID=2829597 RepID=UPI002109003C|nr:outer membrane lipoprotein carrier protein LolA [Kordiimonas sp. SCSIO 12610]UTW55457.1 outer membrane lipoprotein carrier protein LolA [Kordiimonas sp. SCSIO 12610]
MKKTVIFAPLLIMASLMTVPSAAQDNSGDQNQTIKGAEEKSLPALEEAFVEETPVFAAFQKIQSYMNRVNSLQANFTQRSPGGLTSKGKLFMERPGRIRFDYSDETPILVVSDGKILNLVDEEIEQVTKWPVEDTPLRVLLGNSVDLAAYGARVEVEPGGIKNIIALHATDERRPEIGEITIYFRDQQSEGLDLISWVVNDAQGETTVVELFDTETNLKLAGSLWTFEDPRGLAKRRRGVR